MARNAKGDTCAVRQRRTVCTKSGRCRANEAERRSSLFGRIFEKLTW